MVDEISIEAIPMYNLPEDETSRHTKDRDSEGLCDVALFKSIVIDSKSRN